MAELAAGAAHAPLLDEHGRVDEPLIVVDLDTPGEGPLSAARSCERILVGVAAGDLDAGRRELAEALDVTLAPDTAPRFVAATGTALPALADAAEANPQAALTLKQVLRAGALDVPAALDVESFAYSTLLGGPEFARWLQRRGRRPPPPPPPREPVLVAREADRLSVTLNRPERRNAYGREVRDALVHALWLALLDDTIDRVVLDGAGPTFCAGGDLAEFGTTPDPVTAHLVRTRAGAGRLLHELAARTEVRVHGSCVGAGTELPAFAGRVVAHPGTTFRLPEAGMGLIPGAGGTVSIPRRIGRWRALFMGLSGQPVDVPTALDWGLVDSIGKKELDD